MSNSTKDLIDINKKKGFPRTYKFNQFVRWFVIIISLAAILYGMYIIMYTVNPDSSKFQRFAPFFIVFFALNSLLKNMMSLNKIRFESDKLIFGYIARSNVAIPYKDIVTLKFGKGKSRVITITYKTDSGEKSLTFTASFPNMLEILNSIAETNLDIKFGEILKNIIVVTKTKHVQDTEQKNENA